MDLFEIMNSFYNEEKWKKITRYELSKHWFMINRFCSIKFPLQASALNRIKIDGGSGVKYWRNTLNNLYNKTPGWMFTKVIKTKEKEKKELALDERIIKKYCETFKISKREFLEKHKFYGDEFIKEVKPFENMIED
jgi:hypothetical protein